MTFLNTVLRPGGNTTVGGDGELEPNDSAMPVILKATQSTATTDINGLATIVPSSSGISPPLEVDVTVTAGVGGWLDFPLNCSPRSSSGMRLMGSICRPLISRHCAFSAGPWPMRARSRAADYAGNERKRDNRCRVIFFVRTFMYVILREMVECL